MNNYKFATTFMFLVLFLVACDTHHPVNDKLLEAESLMEHAPDSSLAILTQIVTPEKLPDKYYAIWCLLLTQAQDKNYILHTSDSLIQVAVRWFEKKNDKKNLMKSYYYNAVVWDELGDSPRAQQFYLRALDVGKDSEDLALLGRIYANFGTLYIYQDLFDAALDFEKKAVEHFSILKDTTNAGLSLRNIGRIYTKKNLLDSAMIYYKKTLEFANENNHSFIHNDIAGLYKLSGKYLKAFDHIDLALNSFIPDNDTTFIYYNLGNLYRLTGQYESAIHYLLRCLDSPNIHTKAGAYLALSQLEEDRGNWPSYALYQKLYKPIQDSIIRRRQYEKLLLNQNLFNYQQAEREKDFYRLEATKKNLYLYRSLAALSLTLVFLLGFIVYHRRYKRLECERLEKATRIMEQKHHVQVQKNSDWKEKEPIPIFNNPVYQKFMIENVKIKEKDWNELEEEIEKRFPNFTYNLKMLWPMIDISHLRLCYLLKMGIPVKQIADIFCQTSQSISVKRQRLYNKLTGEKGRAADLDSFLIDL